MLGIVDPAFHFGNRFGAFWSDRQRDVSGVLTSFENVKGLVRSSPCRIERENDKSGNDLVGNRFP